jgi:hypothetical protein
MISNLTRDSVCSLAQLIAASKFKRPIFFKFDVFFKINQLVIGPDRNAGFKFPSVAHRAHGRRTDGRVKVGEPSIRLS